MQKRIFVKSLAIVTVVAGLLAGCSVNAEEGTEATNAVSTKDEAVQELSAFETWASSELEWPQWAEPIEMEISEDVKYGPSVRKTFSIEEAHEAIGKLRFLVENSEPTEKYPYHNIWKNSLGTGLLNLGEYQLAYHFLNDVYNLPDDAIYGSEMVDENLVMLTKAEKTPEKILHGRLIKAVSKAGFVDEVLELYAKEDYSSLENTHSWGLTSAAWAMKNIGEYEEAYKLFDLGYQPEPFGEERPYQASSNLLAAASFAYHNGNYDKAIEYTDRIVSEGVEPLNLAYFKGQDLESERRMVYFSRHWQSSYEIAEGLHKLALRAKDGEIADFNALNDGVYTSTNTGYMLTPINVEVTVEGGKVTNINVDQPDEKDDRSAAALATLPDRIVDSSSLEVDSISSATISSESIKLSVAEALLQAK